MADKPSVCVIGCGHMGGSLLRGLLNSGWTAGQLSGLEMDENRGQALGKEIEVVISGDPSEVVTQAAVVILAVNPGQVPAVIQTVRSAMTGTKDSTADKPLLISIAAGVSQGRLQDLSGGDFHVVRAMPNLPVSIGMGITALWAVDVPSPLTDLATQVMGAVGDTVWLRKEDDINVVTATSSSGTAYFYFLMEQMEKTAVRLGLDQATARRLVWRTALGAAHMAGTTESVPYDPSVLRKQVTSPNGTTEAALNVMSEAGFPALVERAVTAARDRAVSLTVDNKAS